MHNYPSNGRPSAVLSTGGATILLGLFTATHLETVTTTEDLDRLIVSLTNYWSVARERLAGQPELTASDERTLDVLVTALIDHLRGSFAL